MKLSNEHTLKDLFARPVFYASEAREAGIHPSRLSYYVKTNRIERIGHGVYRGVVSSVDVDFQWEDLIIIAKSITLQDTKNHEIHTLPMSDFVYELMERRSRNKTSEFVFPADFS